MDIPWWAWFIIGFFSGIGATMLSAVIIIYLQSHNRMPPEMQVLEHHVNTNLDKIGHRKKYIPPVIKVHSIGEDGKTKVVTFDEEK